jgi:hypothetical protein
MKAYEGVEVYLYRLSPYPWKILPGTHCIDGWVGPRAGLDVTAKTKISYPCRESNPNSWIIQPVA